MKSLEMRLFMYTACLLFHHIYISNLGKSDDSRYIIFITKHIMVTIQFLAYFHTSLISLGRTPEPRYRDGHKLMCVYQHPSSSIQWSLEATQSQVLDVRSKPFLVGLGSNLSLGIRYPPSTLGWAQVGPQMHHPSPSLRVCLVRS